MTFNKFMCLMVVLLCSSNSISGQGYDDDDGYDDDYSSEREGRNDAAEEHTGFVTPLDFTPLFGGATFGINNVASAPVKNYQSIFNAGNTNIGPGQDFFQGQSSDKTFSPETFGFVPQLSQGLTAESVVFPKRYQEQNIQFERTKASSTSSDITRSPLQFNIQTNHDVPYKKPEFNAALKSTLQPNKNVDEISVLNSDRLGPYKKYGLQQPGNILPTYQSLTEKFPSTSYPELNQYNTRNLRQKRYSNKRKSKSRKARQQEESDEDEPQYNYRSDYSSRPKEFDESNVYEAPDFKSYDESSAKGDYSYGDDEEFGFDEYERIKSLSQQQAAQLKKHPENCKQVKKDSMICTVCSDPKTGGNYESCAYASEPKNNKYAYVKEQKYDSNDEPENEEESKEIAQTENPQKVQKVKSKKSNKKPKKQNYEKLSNYKYSSPTNKPTRYVKVASTPTNAYDEYYASPTIETSSLPQKYSAYSQNNEEDDESDNNEDEDEQTDNDYYNNDEQNSPIPGFFTNNENKKDVESVLAEFNQKDRSSCKKVLKDHMTCYQCVDKKGMKHEECMFVSESAPKTSHLAYKEVKEFNSKPTPSPEGNDEAESKIITAKPLAELILSTTESSVPSFPKTKKNKVVKKYSELNDFKKVIPTISNLSPLDAFSTQFKISSTASTDLNFSPNKVVIKREATQSKQVNKRYDEIEHFNEAPSSVSYLDNIADPDEFAGAESRGAFWAETIPVFSKKLGMALPRYMLDKTEEELDFERTLVLN